MICHISLEYVELCHILLRNIIKHMITQYFKDILLKKIKDISQGGMCNLHCY